MALNVLTVQGGIFVTALDISMFTNIATDTYFHVHSFEITKCELFLICELLLPERLPSGVTVKLYRGDFLGTLAHARALHTQATENRKINLGFYQGTYCTSS